MEAADNTREIESSFSLQNFSEEVQAYLKSHENVLQNLIKYNQIHLLHDINDLDQEGLNQFFKCLADIDFELMRNLYNELIINPKELNTKTNTIEPIENKFPLKDLTTSDYDQWRLNGLKMISEGQVGIVLLSGGQGTRLGFEHPKGKYNIGMPSGKTLFEYFANRIFRIQQIAHETFPTSKKNITWYLLTSEMNHQEIVDYFTDNKYFGLDPEHVKFFYQQSLPALDKNGKIVLEDKNKIHMSPNGNGGVFSSLYRHGMLNDMRQRGIKYVHMFGVDNVLVKPADPFLLGFSKQKDFQLTCKYVPKKYPEEKVGVHILLNGKSAVVEYTEISKEMSERVDENGSLVFDASHIVNALYTLDFLESVSKGDSLELARLFHLAKKKLKYYDQTEGKIINPTDINGYKFELLIFDVFPLGDPTKFGLVEARREEEFAPVKNAPGTAVDSPDSARELLTKLHQNWFEKRGVQFDKNANKDSDNQFEIDFASVYDEKDPNLDILAERFSKTLIQLPTFIQNK